MNPFDSYLILSLSLDIYLFDDILLCINYQRLYCCLLFIILHEFIKWHVQLFLIDIWCLTCRTWPTNITLVNISDITSIYYPQGLFYLIRVSSLTGWPVSTNVCIRQYVVCFSSVEMSNILRSVSKKIPVFFWVS